MQMTPVSFWLRIVSIATAVLPVWRSPMISSRWPRPIGTMPSIDLRPVCIGSRTGWRSTTPGAMRSIGETCLVRIGPLPSIGWPSALTTRPSISSPTGTEMMRPVRLTGSPSLICGVLAEQHRADAVFFEVQRDAEHAVRELEHLAGHGALAAVHARDAVAERHHGADFGHVDRDGEAADLFANNLGDLVCFDRHCSSSYQLLAHPLQLRLHAAVVHRAADLRDHAAEQLGIDADRQFHFLAGDLRQALFERLGLLRRQRRGARHFGAHDVLVREQALAIRRGQVGQ